MNDQGSMWGPRFKSLLGSRRRRVLALVLVLVTLVCFLAYKGGMHFAKNWNDGELLYAIQASRYARAASLTRGSDGPQLFVKPRYMRAALRLRRKGESSSDETIHELHRCVFGSPEIRHVLRIRLEEMALLDIGVLSGIASDETRPFSTRFEALYLLGGAGLADDAARSLATDRLLSFVAAEQGEGMLREAIGLLRLIPEGHPTDLLAQATMSLQQRRRIEAIMRQHFDEPLALQRPVVLNAPGMEDWGLPDGVVVTRGHGVKGQP